MSPISVPGKLILSHIQQYPTFIGEPFGGGFFAGYISHTANGIATHALIVAPVESGATGTQYGSATFTGSISGTTLTVTDVASGTILTGMPVASTGGSGNVLPNTFITAFVPGSGSEGGVGQYTVSASQTVTSRGMTTGTAILPWALNQNASDGTNYSTTSIGSVANADFDGEATMAVLASIGIANFPAALFCSSLSINSVDDWYLPSRYELDIAYYNLKPDLSANNTASGINPYSVPRRTVNNTVSLPSQTNVSLFQTSGSQRFGTIYHWSATEGVSNRAWDVRFSDGDQGTFSTGNTKNGGLSVRAFRKIAL
jgi:hypothetical protein